MSELNLKLIIETEGADKAKEGLDGLDKGVDKTTKGVDYLTRRMGVLQARALEMNAAMGASTKGADYLSRSMALLQTKALEMDGAISHVTTSLEHGTAAHEPHIHGLSRIGNSLATLVGHATGVPPVLERIGDALAITAFGHLATVGVLAGFAAIAFAYEKITEKAREAAKEIEKTRLAVAEAANEGKTDPIREAGRKLEFGQPFDKDGNLVANSAFVKGAFKGSLKDLEAELVSLQDRFYATTNGFTQQKIQQQIIGVLNSLKPLRKLSEEIRAAGANIASQPGENAGTLNGITVTASSGEALARLTREQDAQILAQRLDAWNHFLKEQQAEYKRASEQTVKDFETEQDEETAIGLEQARERARNEQRVYKEEGERSLRLLADSKTRAGGMNLSQLREAIGKSLEEGGVLMDDAVRALAAHMNQSLSTILGDGISAGLEKAFSGRSGDAFKSLTASVLAGLGGFMQALGAQMIIVGLALDAFARALLTLNGPGAILAGVALVAAGAGLKAIASNISGSMAPGRETGSPSNIPPTFLSFGVQAAGTPTTGLSAPQAKPNNYFTIIGNDPKVQRDIAAIVNSADDRGLIRRSA